MILVFGLAALIWSVGHMARWPVLARLLMLGLLYVVVLAVQFAFDEDHPIRMATGASPAEWLFLGMAVALIWAYRKGLAALRSRVDHTQSEPAVAKGGPFNDQELERYARHIVLREVGGAGQRALKETKVLVVGAGGLGAPVLLYLAAAGVGRIGVIDGDTVDLSNLQRQVIHTDARIDMPKVFSAETAMKAINPHVDVRPYYRVLNTDIAEDLLADYDIIVDGTDSFDVRQIVNRAAVETGRPLVAGAISQWEGQVTVYDPASGAPCLACIFPDPPAPGQAPSCAEAGVMGALPGMVGSQMAGEVIKLITRAGTPLRGRMMIHDMLHGETRTITVRRRADCPCCSDI